MIAIYMTEDETQVIRATVRRGKFNVVGGDSIDPYLPYLLNSDVGQVAEMFREAQECLRCKDDEVCVILPDHIFRKIGCYNNTENLEAEIKDDLRVPIESCSISYPLIINKKTLQKKTVCALDKGFTDVLISAAKQMKMALLSIEPAGYVFLKATRKWEKEQMALFISDKNASLLSYNPLGGIFVQRLGQNLSYARAKDDMDVLDLVMRETLAAADFANKESFRLVNKNVPVYIIADRFEDYFKLPSLQPRFADLPINNGLIEDVDDEDYRYFIIPITALYEAMFPSGISSPKLQFMQLYSANVIPQDVTQSSRRVMLRKVIKKWAQVAAIAGVAVIGVEAAGSVYFSSASIPDALQREHTVAMTKQGEVNNELERIKQQHLEDENVIGALNSVVMSKPDGLGFTEIEVGQRGSSNEAQRIKNWVHLTAKTKDPMVIQDYISRLTANPTFSGVVIEEIAGDDVKEDSVKRARLVVGRAR